MGIVRVLDVFNGEISPSSVRLKKFVVLHCQHSWHLGFGNSAQSCPIIVSECNLQQIQYLKT